MGLVKSNMKQEAPNSVEQQTNVPPQFKEAYDKVVLAGMKILFSEQTNQEFLKQLDPNNVPQSLGKAIAGLMLLMFSESNKTMPPQVIIPAGVQLLIQAADFMNRGKVAPMDKDVIGQALQVFVQLITQRFGQKGQAQMGAGQQQAPQQGAQQPMQQAPQQPMQQPMQQPQAAMPNQGV